MIKAGQTIDAADLIISIIAGENITANDAIYISTADGKAYRTDSDDLTKLGFAGFAQETITTGNAITIKLNGIMAGFSGLTVGTEYFLSGTTGAITATPPTNFKSVGVALTTTTLRIATWLTKRVRIYSGTITTWTKYDYIKYIDLDVQAAGASGGGSTASNIVGSGGGAGGRSLRTMRASDITSPVTIWAGTGGVVVSNADGKPGNPSSFGTYATASAGSAGVKGTAGSAPAGGTGGVGASGDLNFSGGDGGYGSGALDIGGYGGAAPGGGSTKQSQAANGQVGKSYGGGGGGGSNSQDAGAGADGYVSVTEYY